MTYGDEVALGWRMASREKLLTFAALLLLTGLASCKDTQHTVELGDEQRGEVMVDGSDPVLRFHVRSSGASAIRIEATADVPEGHALLPPVEVSVSPDVAFRDPSSTSDAGGAGAFEISDGTTARFDLAGEKCKSGCEQDVQLRLARHAPGQPPLRVRWVVKAGLEVWVLHDEEANDDYVDVTREN